MSVLGWTRSKNGLTPSLNIIMKHRRILTNDKTNLHRHQTEATHFVVKGGEYVINEWIINMTIAPLYLLCSIKMRMTLYTKPNIVNGHETVKDCVWIQT